MSRQASVVSNFIFVLCLAGPMPVMLYCKAKFLVSSNFSIDDTVLVNVGCRHRLRIPLCEINQEKITPQIMKSIAFRLLYYLLFMNTSNTLNNVVWVQENIIDSIYTHNYKQKAK